MQRNVTVLGAAPNVDLRGKRDVEAHADRDRRQVIDVNCLTCSHSERVHVEPGDDRYVEHDRQNATHVVEYVERGGR